MIVATALAIVRLLGWRGEVLPRGFGKARLKVIARTFNRLFISVTDSGMMISDE